MNRKIVICLTFMLAIGYVHVAVSGDCYSNLLSPDDCYDGDPTTEPSLVDDGYDCSVDSIEDMDNSDDLSPTDSGGHEYSTATKCTITWICTKPDEQTETETTEEDVNTNYDQEEGDSCPYS